jgi:hypothetical protein
MNLPILMAIDVDLKRGKFHHHTDVNMQPPHQLILQKTLNQPGVLIAGTVLRVRLLSQQVPSESTIMYAAEACNKWTDLQLVPIVFNRH